MVSHAGSDVAISGSPPRLIDEGSKTTVTRGSLSSSESSTYADGSRGISGQFHAEGGKTDGCYALYGVDAGAERTVDQLLGMIQVGG